jgi:penicillin-binding protein 2
VVPLLNRATTPFVPGSTYKVPIALAGCLANMQARTYHCSGSVTYGNTPMQCWIARQGGGGSHGSLGLSDALRCSCNCFFYQYGNSTGIDNITKVGKLFGLGERTGIELEDELPGRLPNPQWLRMYRPSERWSSGATANTSIGQGMVEATPLQMASVTAAVASGKVYKPHLLYQVKDGEQIIEPHKPQLRTDLSQSFSTQKLDLVRKGMWKVVNDPGGTAKTARIPGIEVAGKTGTAQNWRRTSEKGNRVVDNHTLFISYAPYQKAKFAVCVIVQGGKSGGTCAAPVAKRVLEQSLALEQGYNPKIVRLDEVSGNFNSIEVVKYADSGTPLIAAAPADDDGDTGTQAEDRTEASAPAPRPKAAAPNIRRQADSRGSSSKTGTSKKPKASPKRIPAKAPASPAAPSAPGGFFKKLLRNI